jgi:hypothetical protein
MEIPPGNMQVIKASKFHVTLSPFLPHTWKNYLDNLYYPDLGARFCRLAAGPNIRNGTHEFPSTVRY